MSFTIICISEEQSAEESLFAVPLPQQDYIFDMLSAVLKILSKYSAIPAFLLIRKTSPSCLPAGLLIFHSPYIPSDQDLYSDYSRLHYIVGQNFKLKLILQ